VQKIIEYLRTDGLNPKYAGSYIKECSYKSIETITVVQYITVCHDCNTAYNNASYVKDR